ncbi:MAG: hypothetical protein WBP46_00780 [Thiolinea sp.]
MNSLSKLIQKLNFNFFTKKTTAIIYYVYINPAKNWQRLISDQLEDVKNTGVFAAADLYIVVSNPFKATDVDLFFEKIDVSYKEIEFHRENKFEYWGMFFIWKLVHSSSQYQYIVYFHTKGMTHTESSRVKTEKLLTGSLFKDWKLFISLFKKNNKINKIGLFPAWKVNDQGEIVRGGWIWYNFWWARADYIKALEQPKIDPKHRFYYEEWLSYPVPDTKNKLYDSYSIYSKTVSSYTNKEVLEITEKLIKTY